jgi:SAM-dependent methyltransferase
MASDHENPFNPQVPDLEDFKTIINFLRQCDYSKLQSIPYKDYDFLYVKHLLPEMLEQEQKTLLAFNNNDPILYEQTFNKYYYEREVGIDHDCMVLADIFLHNHPMDMDQVYAHCKEIYKIITKYAIVDGETIIFPYRIVPIYTFYLIADPLTAKDKETVFLFRDSFFLSSYILLHLNFTNMTVLDCGIGSGILSLMAATKQPKKVYGIDINPRAVAFAGLNKQLNGIQTDVEFVESSFEDFDSSFDICISNPPYMLNPRCHCESEDGGEHYGLDLALNLVEKVQMARKRLILILAAPIINGVNHFEAQLQRVEYKKRFSERQTLISEMEDDIPYTEDDVTEVELAIFDIAAP